MKITQFGHRDRGAVKKITMIKPHGGSAGVRQIYGNDEDSSDTVPVRIIRPGTGTVMSMHLVTQAPTGGTSGFLRPIERGVRKLVVREAEIAHSYLTLHKRSNQRKRNGWMKDLPRNILRAVKTDD